MGEEAEQGGEGGRQPRKLMMGRVRICEWRRECHTRVNAGV